MIQVLTPIRLANLLAGQAAYLLSLLAKKPFVWGLPAGISIEPASVCNLSCPHCPAGTGKISRANAVIEPEVFRNIIDQVAPYTWYLMLYFQGEPLLHSDFYGLVSYAAKRRMYTVTATNGQLVTAGVAQKIIDSGLNELIISVDGTSQETYSAYRIGGELEILKEGIRQLVKRKKEQRRYYPRIIIQFIVFRHNQHQVMEIRKMARELGANGVRLKSAHLYPVAGAGNLLPDEEKFRRYIITPDGNLLMKRQLLNRCGRIWHTAVVTSDGDLVPCCFDKEASVKIGSLKERSVKELWQSSAFMSFRQEILKERIAIDICNNCTGGLGKEILR